MADEGLKVITYKELKRKLKRLGFIEIRTSKHPVYFNEARNITIPVPSHSGDVPKGLLRKIIKEIDISNSPLTKGDTGGCYGTWRNMGSVPDFVHLILYKREINREF